MAGPYILPETLSTPFGTTAPEQDTPCKAGDADPDLWFDDDPAAVAQAKAICGGCWFRDKCREIGQSEDFGVWGGEHRTYQLTQTTASNSEWVMRGRNRQYAVALAWRSGEHDLNKLAEEFGYAHRVAIREALNKYHPTWRQEQLADIAETRRKIYTDHKNGLSQRAVARKHDLPRRTVERWITWCKKNEDNGEDQVA